MTEPQPKPLRRSVALGPLLRQAHLYLGMLIAPSILMFAVTGGLQIFRLQEAHPGYAPPPVIERLGRLHKDQVFTVAPPRRARSEAAGKAGPGRAAEAPRPGPALSKRLLQWFFTLVAAGLFASTLLGVWLGAMMSRWKVSARWTLLAGVVIPVVMLLV